jgi:hypothetical protein
MVVFKSVTSLSIFVNAAAKDDAEVPWNDPRAALIVTDWVPMSLASLVILLRRLVTAEIVAWGTSATLSGWNVRKRGG